MQLAGGAATSAATATVKSCPSFPLLNKPVPNALHRKMGFFFFPSFSPPMRGENASTNNAARAMFAADTSCLFICLWPRRQVSQFRDQSARASMSSSVAGTARAMLDTIEALLSGSEQLESSEWFFRLQQQCSGLRQPLNFEARGSGTFHCAPAVSATACSTIKQ